MSIGFSQKNFLFSAIAFLTDEGVFFCGQIMKKPFIKQHRTFPTASFAPWKSDAVL